MKKVLFVLIILLAAGGLSLSLTLSHLHYELLSGNPLKFQFCQKGCDAVNVSSYSELFEIPIACYGAVLYGLILLAALLAAAFFKEQPVRSFFLALIFLFSLFSFSASLALAGISFFKLSSFCHLCGLTYLINFFLVWAGGMALEVPLPQMGSQIGKSLSFLLRREAKQNNIEFRYQRKILFLSLFTCLLWISSGMGMAYFYSGKYRILNKERTEKFLQGYATLPRLILEAEGAPSKGSQTPKVTLVIFSDFACVHCRAASFLLDRLLPEYQRDLRIVYKHYPHDHACNPYDEQPSPKKACLLSKASLCAQRAGKFWEYHDLLFKSDNIPAPEELPVLASKVGMAPDPFETCLNDPQTESALLKDIEEAHRLGTSSTPTLFFNGKMVQGLPPTPILHLLIQHEIREKSGR